VRLQQVLRIGVKAIAYEQFIGSGGKIYFDRWKQTFFFHESPHAIPTFAL
jgi:hypothetical protein